MTQLEMMKAQLSNMKRDAWEIVSMPDRPELYKKIAELAIKIRKLELEFTKCHVSN